MSDGGDAGWKRMVEEELRDLRSDGKEQRSDARKMRDWMMMLLGAGGIIGGVVSLFAKQIFALLVK